MRMYHTRMKVRTGWSRGRRIFLSTLSVVLTPGSQKHFVCPSVIHAKRGAPEARRPRNILWTKPVALTAGTSNNFVWTDAIHAKRDAALLLMRQIFYYECCCSHLYCFVALLALKQPVGLSTCPFFQKSSHGFAALSAPLYGNPAYLPIPCTL